MAISKPIIYSKIIATLISLSSENRGLVASEKMFGLRLAKKLQNSMSMSMSIFDHPWLLLRYWSKTAEIVQRTTECPLGSSETFSMYNSWYLQLLINTGAGHARVDQLGKGRKWWCIHSPTANRKISCISASSCGIFCSGVGDKGTGTGSLW